MAVPSSTFTTFEIENDDAVEDSAGKYEICARSGLKQKVGSLVQEWSGAWVRPESYEPKHPQLMVRSRQDKLRGAVRPEAADVFVSTTTAPSDL